MIYKGLFSLRLWTKRLFPIVLLLREWFTKEKGSCGEFWKHRQNNKESYYVENGFLDIEKKISVSRETIFRIFSMTKPIVSTAAMKLFELK